MPKKSQYFLRTYFWYLSPIFYGRSKEKRSESFIMTVNKVIGTFGIGSIFKVSQLTIFWSNRLKEQHEFLVYISSF